MSTDILAMSAVEIAAAVAKRTLGVAEVTEAFLARIAVLNPVLLRLRSATPATLATYRIAASNSRVRSSPDGDFAGRPARRSVPAGSGTDRWSSQGGAGAGGRSWGE